jgi:hypothetical protein
MLFLEKKWQKIRHQRFEDIIIKAFFYGLFGWSQLFFIIIGLPIAIVKVLTIQALEAKSHPKKIQKS